MNGPESQRLCTPITLKSDVVEKPDELADPIPNRLSRLIKTLKFFQHISQILRNPTKEMVHDIESK